MTTSITAPEPIPAADGGRGRPLRAAVALETALLVALFIAYRLGRLLTAEDTTAAFANSDRLWGWQRSLGLPSEGTVQGWLLHSRSLAEAANTYYAAVHFPATVAFLVWMFFRRPAAYLWVRRSLVLLTGAGLVGHMLFPLAPPRMRPDLGFVDTAAAYGPAVYGPPDGGSVANQFAAMPSLHIGWAALVAVGLIATTRSRWRWLWLAHPAITVMVVVATANHYWLDGVVAVALLAVALAVVPAAARWRPWRTQPLPPRTDSQEQPT